MLRDISSAGKGRKHSLNGDVVFGRYRRGSTSAGHQQPQSVFHHSTSGSSNKRRMASGAAALPRTKPRRDFRLFRTGVCPQRLHGMTTSDDTAQTWRDLAGQLTAAQITQLERLECDDPQTLQKARQWAAKNMAASASFNDVAPPAGAVRTFGWQRDSNWFRDFEGTKRCAGQARVHVFGRQQADGSTRRWIAVYTRRLDALNASAARDLAAALNDAADEIERLG
jgi:hypothetical protein